MGVSKAMAGGEHTKKKKKQQALSRQASAPWQQPHTPPREDRVAPMSGSHPGPRRSKQQHQEAPRRSTTTSKRGVDSKQNGPNAANPGRRKATGTAEPVRNQSNHHTRPGARVATAKQGRRTCARAPYAAKKKTTPTGLCSAFSHVAQPPWPAPPPSHTSGPSADCRVPNKPHGQEETPTNGPGNGRQQQDRRGYQRLRPYRDLRRPLVTATDA